MLTTILVEHPWLTTAALVALVLVGPGAGAWLAHRPRLTTWLLGLAVVVVAVLTLTPTSRQLQVGCYFAWDLPQLGAVELMANVVLFAPLVLLAGVRWRRPLVALLAATAVSALIEVAQAFTPALGRSCSSDDWLSNTLGALLGAVLALVALRIAPMLRRR
ncbi:MAG: VanZ family protein [Nocardioides sp.]|nr:VanZ family protein [Nocardioides sp.]